jgi:short-subunit dehydrogenase
MELKDKVVIVTGASRGLGEQMAYDLGRRGAQVVLAARDLAGLEKVAAAIRSAGGRATPVSADLGTAAGREKLIAAAEAVGPIDVLVNNAGIEITVAVADQTPQEIEQQVAVNLVAPMLLTRAVLPKMLQRNQGWVVMVSSMSGKGATPYNAIYAATKHGICGFTSSLRLELLDTAVHVGVLCPGFVAGGMWAETGLKAPASMKEVSMDDVVRGMHEVLDGAVEVLVTRGPIRIGLALTALFPSFEATGQKRMGILETMKARHATTLAKRNAAPKG